MIAASSASAEPSCAPPEKGSSEADDRGEALYKKGIDARADEQWETARAFFLQACQISPHFQILANLGEAELKLGMYRHAAEHLSAFLAAAPSTLSSVARAKGEEMLAKARLHVGTVALTVHLPEAVVLVDGAPVGRAPLKGSLFVEPGLREFEARGAGGVKAKKVHRIAPGSQVTVELEPKPQTGPRLVLPPAQPSGPAQPQSFPVFRREPNATTGSSGGWRGPVITTGVVMSAAAVAVGIGNVIAVFAVPNPNDDATQRIFGNVALWHFVGAGVLGAGALTLWITQPSSRSDEAAPSPTVAVAAGGQGIQIEGRW